MLYLTQNFGVGGHILDWSGGSFPDPDTKLTPRTGPFMETRRGTGTAFLAAGLLHFPGGCGWRFADVVVISNVRYL